MIIHTGADILLLDEPTAGLAEKETGMTADAVKLFKKHGLTIIVVEHDLKFIKQIAEKITVMHQGGVFCEGFRVTLNNVEVKNIPWALNESVLCFDYPRCVQWIRNSNCCT